VSEKRVPKERIQLYLRPEICAWLASQPEGRNVPAGEALESWIVGKEYPTVRDRYCRGLSDAQILMLNRGEIAEMAEDDDIPLVWMILQGGARRAVASVPEVPDNFPVVLDPKMRTDEWRLRNNNPHLVKLPDAESVPVVLDPTMMLEGYEARAEESQFTVESAIAHIEAYLNGGDELGYVPEADVEAATKFLRERLLGR
jgi:hypothetical protein